MIFTLLKQIPGAVASRIGNEFRRVMRAPEPPPADIKPEPDRSDAQRLIGLVHALNENYVATAVRGVQIDIARAPQSFRNHPNAVTKCGAKVFSQTDEDGITFEIIRRIGISKGTFAEFGVEEGYENNTLALAAAGWNGFWVGGEDLAFNVNPNAATKLNFSYDKQWVTLGKLAEIYQSNLHRIGQARCNLISMDLDGNDYYFVEKLLALGAAPEIFIVEYNAKFRPPIEFVIDYRDDHVWNGDDYFGASLSSFCTLFKRHGYFLVCCNLTGANAFFVRDEYRAAFTDVPAEIEQIFESAKYFFVGLMAAAHPISAQTIKQIFSRLNPPDSAG